MALALLVVLAVIAWLLIRMTPSWYVPFDSTSQHAIDLMDRAQLRLGSKLHNAMESVPVGEQSWSISQDEVNALIAARRGSLPVTGPLVIFTPGKITLAARSKYIPSGNPDGGVGSVVIRILHTPAQSPSELPANAIKIHSVWLGYLPVPKAIVESRLASMAPEIVAAVQQQMSLQAGASPRIQKIEPTLTGVLYGEPLPEFTYNQRQIIIKEIRVDEGLFTIIFAPSPHAPAVVPPRPHLKTSPVPSKK